MTYILLKYSKTNSEISGYNKTKGTPMNTSDFNACRTLCQYTFKLWKNYMSFRNFTLHNNKKKCWRLFLYNRYSSARIALYEYFTNNDFVIKWHKYHECFNFQEKQFLDFYILLKKKNFQTTHYQISHSHYAGKRLHKIRAWFERGNNYREWVHTRYYKMKFLKWKIIRIRWLDKSAKGCKKLTLYNML